MVNNTDYFERVQESASFVRGKHSANPKLMVVLTAGLDDFIEGLDDRHEIAFAEIPHFGKTSVQGHEGKLIFGQRAGIPIVAMKGRFHFYEGYDPAKVVFPYFVMERLGVHAAITTNAVGGVRYDLNAGDIMLVNDHINMMGMNPLIGIANLREKNQFVGMTDAYDDDLIAIARRAASVNGIELKNGVFAAVSGPSYETKAEIKALRILGVDAVGMSTVPEVIAARFLGMKMLTLSIVANAAADRHEGMLSHDEVLSEVAAAAPKMVKLLGAITNEVSNKIL